MSMREFKFRVWDNKDKAMYTGSACYLLMTSQGELWGLDPFKPGGMFSCNNDYIPMQYTGLKDKYGKEIYEGDIDFTDEEYMIVTFEMGAFGLKFPNDNASFDACIDFDELTIVGNIYENKELINDSL